VLSNAALEIADMRVVSLKADSGWQHSDRTWLVLVAAGSAFPVDQCPFKAIKMKLVVE